jgi:D-glycero-alpha-D-manno-heptose-7-phosphate kinase
MARVVATAPGRIDFGGGWTDVPPYTTERGGTVCNVALDLRATAELRPSPVVVPPADALVRAAWERAGTPAVTLALASAIPIGSGLGGSSAAGVALAAALATHAGAPLAGSALAEWSRETEVHQLGVPGGCQDHFAAAYGGALELACGAATVATPIALDDHVIGALEDRCVVAFTGASRISATTITGVLDAYVARDPEVCDALDAMAWLARDMARALREGDVDLLGTLVHEHWAHQRALHPAITTDTIDAIAHDAQVAGALGTKALGASGGGCVVVIARDDRIREVRAAVAAHATLLPMRVARHGVRVTVIDDADDATDRVVHDDVGDAGRDDARRGTDAGR